MLCNSLPRTPWGSQGSTLPGRAGARGNLPEFSGGFLTILPGPAGGKAAGCTLNGCYPGEEAKKLGTLAEPGQDGAPFVVKEQQKQFSNAKAGSMPFAFTLGGLSYLKFDFWLQNFIQDDILCIPTCR